MNYSKNVHDKQLVILSSGVGTNLQKIIDSIENNILKNCKINLVISNKDSESLVRAKKHKISNLFLKWNKQIQTRIEYDLNLVNIINAVEPFLVVLAGWNHILSKEFLDKLCTTNIINLHPALPGAFPGNSAIKDAYNAFLENKIKYTGIMVHKVTPVVDVGEIILTKQIPIYKSDKLTNLINRIKLFEKEILIKSINIMAYGLIKQGKVRDIYDCGQYLIMAHTDRLSAADKHVTNIDGKGHILSKISEFWFDKTSNIVNNHVIKYHNNYLVCKKCTVIPVEFIVRGYIAGNSKTSLWKNYNDGARTYCGITFQDGLVKNQKLDTPVVTPTTKGETDELINLQYIIDNNILNQDNLNFIIEKCYQLYNYGSQIASENGLILVDTKYEFGITCDGEIILIDEIHTPDSSRYWIKDTYESLFNNNEEPEKLDKDCIREYLLNIKKENTTENTTDTIEIPESLKNRVKNTYESVYNKLTNNTINHLNVFDKNDVCDDINELRNIYDVNLAIILYGSNSDINHVEKIVNELNKLNIPNEYYQLSAHKQTRALLDLLDKFNSINKKIIYITVAGRSNALSGVVSGHNKKFPVIACPPFNDKLDMVVNINSSLQMPSNTPVMTIIEPNNVALSCNRIFNF